MRSPSPRSAVARSARLFILLAPLVGHSAAVGGCNGASGSDGDAGGDGTTTFDGPRPATDGALADQRGPDLGPSPPADGAGTDGAGTDGAETDGAGTDGSPPANGSCAGAEVLGFVGDTAVANGDTRPLTDEHPAPRCKGTGDSSETTMAGPQAYYRFDTVAGQWYKITLDPTFSAYVYVFAGGCDAAQIQTDCQSGGVSGETSTFISAGVPESFYYLAARSGQARVAVDSTSATNAGTFTLSVARIAKPTNGSCGQAPLLGFAAGKAQATGNIGPTLTPDEHSTLSCGTGKPFDGPQAYYRFVAAPDKAYRVELTADTAMFLHAYVFGGSCDATAIEAACASAGKAGDVLGKSVSGGGSESFLFMPEATGTYTVAVDTRSPTSYGGFSLAIEELTPADNATCAAPTALTLAPSGGGDPSVTVTGSTSTATNEHGVAVTCGGQTALDGPQVYYALDVAPGTLDVTPDRGYRVTLRPQFRAQLYALRQASCSAGAAAINADCGAPAGGGSWGPILAGAEGTLFVHPDQPGTYLLAVDSASNTAAGDFELTVTEVDLPSNTRCSAPTPITLDATGAATIEASTGFSSDQYGGLQCGPQTPSLNGPQLYYALPVKASRFYELALTTTFFDAYLYLFSSATCSQQTLAADCGSAGAKGEVLGPVSVATEVLYHRPASDGLLRLAVDSAISPLADEYGDFRLEVRERKPSANGSCAAAAALPLVDQSGSALGFTVGLADEHPGAIGCGGGLPFAAGQAYYRVELTAGADYLVQLKADFPAQLYAFAAAGGGCPDAATIEAACAPGGAGGHLAVAAGGRGALVLRPASDGGHYLVVDGQAARDVGGFELAVAPVPSNQRCATPEPIPLSSSPATASGDTGLGVANEFGSVDCGNVGGPWPGPQLYYRATLQAGTAYTIKIAQDGWDPALYAFAATTACAAADIDLACADPTPTDPDNVHSSDNLGIGDETITVKPTTTADWVIVVDSFSATGASGAGSFTLEITW